MEYVDKIIRSPKELTRLAKQYALSGKRDAADRNRISGALAQAALSKDCQEATRAFLERNTGGGE